MTTEAKKSAKSVSVGVGKKVRLKGKTKLSLASPFGKKTRSAKAKPARKVVTFGSVTIQVAAPHQADVRRNIKAGQTALARAMTTIVTPGVTLDIPKGVPLYHADPDHPDQLVRVLDEKHEHGVLVNGRFKKTGR